MTAFDRDFAEWMRDPAFESAYREERARIDALDAEAGDACSTCGGHGTVRVKGRPGWERIPCPDCGGTGMRGGPYRG